MADIAADALHAAASDHERSVMMRLAAMARRGFEDQWRDMQPEWGPADSNLNTVRIRHHDLGQFELIVRKVID